MGSNPIPSTILWLS